MPVKTLVADRSTLLAWAPGGFGLGAGQEAHLPINLDVGGGGYDLRAAVGFTFPAGFWDDVKKLTLAELVLTNTPSTAHVAKGASGVVYIYRATSQWESNGAAESWTTGPTVYPGPSAVATGGGGFASDPTAGLAQGFGITGIAMAWAPASVVDAGGTPGQGAICYGVSLQESGGSAQSCEFVSALGASGARPFLRLTYESNSPPNAPTLVYPVGPNQIASKFKFSTVDPEGDAISNYDLQVSTDPTFATVSHWNVANGTGSLSGATVDVNYAGTVLVVGNRYYWRARMRDVGSGQQSPWSTIATFVKGAAGPAEDLYDYWMAAILADMAFGRTVLRVGTLRPRGDQVAKLTSGEYGDPYDLVWDEVSPTVEETLYLLGLNVALTPDGWAITAVFELAKEVGSL